MIWNLEEVLEFLGVVGQQGEKIISRNSNKYRGHKAGVYDGCVWVKQRKIMK